MPHLLAQSGGSQPSVVLTIRRRPPLLRRRRPASPPTAAISSSLSLRPSSPLFFWNRSITIGPHSPPMQSACSHSLDWPSAALSLTSLCSISHTHHNSNRPALPPPSSASSLSGHPHRSRSPDPPPHMHHHRLANSRSSQGFVSTLRDRSADAVLSPTPQHRSTFSFPTRCCRLPFTVVVVIPLQIYGQPDRLPRCQPTLPFSSAVSHRSTIAAPDLSSLSLDLLLGARREIDAGERDR